MVEVDDVLMCRMCVKLMDGLTPLDRMDHEQLVSLIRDKDVEIQSLKAELYGLANKMAEKIYEDAK